MEARTGHIQVVWDRDDEGTALSCQDASLRIGSHQEWTPLQLLTAAVESGLMTEFLRLAEQERLTVLGYVSAAEATLADAPTEAPLIRVRPCVIVSRSTRPDIARELLERAARESAIVRCLRDAVLLEPEVVGVDEDEP